MSKFSDLFVISIICCIFAAENKKITIMTAIELNAEILRNMSIIAEDEKPAEASRQIFAETRF